MNTTMKHLPTAIILFLFFQGKGQTCDCEKEFLFIKKTVEQNFSGFDDKIRLMSKKVYNRKVDSFLQLTHNRFAIDNCPVVIEHYLQLFASHHLGLHSTSDPKTDTGFIRYRPSVPISDKEIQRLEHGTSWEGIYYSFDSTYKIAVLKDPSPMHDYIGVMLESKVPAWKKGMVKFEGKLKNDSLLLGTLYMRNQRPKAGNEEFYLWQNNNRISGDWRREGTPIVQTAPSNTPLSDKPSPVIYAKMLTPNTLYIRLKSFDLGYLKMIDSVIKANDGKLRLAPNLIVDVRDNGGGSDAGWGRLIPYLYTQPIKNIGADILSTDNTIAAYKKKLDDKNEPKENIAFFKQLIPRMEKAKGAWVLNDADGIDSSFVPKQFPKKVVILINKWCGSSTEEFLFTAKQSSKVILAGENTVGNLDYSNIVEVPFSCYPYNLVYPTTRSRRLDINQGIDNVGIAPDHPFTEKEDWIKEALKIVEN